MIFEFLLQRQHFLYCAPISKLLRNVKWNNKRRNKSIDDAFPIRVRDISNCAINFTIDVLQSYRESATFHR